MSAGVAKEIHCVDFALIVLAIVMQVTVNKLHAYISHANESHCVYKQMCFELKKLSCIVHESS